MKNITVKNILQATGAVLLCGDEETVVENIALDSRKMNGADIFVPIIGEKTDGHLYIDKAFDNGAVATFTSEDVETDGVHVYIKVDDTVDALQKFGAYLRDRLQMQVIGVTGSVGKTTTRQMIALAISACKKVTATKGNSNSQVGVPVTLSLLDEDADIAVIEMGVSKPGEMDKLADIVRPDYAVITNIGDSHIEFMGSQQHTFKEKFQITKHFSKDNIFFIEGDDGWNGEANVVANTKGFKVITYGKSALSFFRADDIKLDALTSTFTFKRKDEALAEVRLSVPGMHNVINATCALTICYKLGLDVKACAKKLEEYKGFDGRMNIEDIGGITLIDDSYNASFDSTCAALEVFEKINPAEGGKKIIVFGDIKEIGSQSELTHMKLGTHVVDARPDVLYTVGSEASITAEVAKAANIDVHPFDKAEDVLGKILGIIKPGDVILLKASNSVGLGKIAKQIKEKFS